MGNITGLKCTHRITWIEMISYEVFVWRRRRRLRRRQQQRHCYLAENFMSAVWYRCFVSNHIGGGQNPMLYVFSQSVGSQCGAKLKHTHTQQTKCELLAVSQALSQFFSVDPGWKACAKWSYFFLTFGLFMSAFFSSTTLPICIVYIVYAYTMLYFKYSKHPLEWKFIELKEEENKIKCVCTMYIDRTFIM